VLIRYYYSSSVEQTAHTRYVQILLAIYPLHLAHVLRYFTKIYNIRQGKFNIEKAFLRLSGTFCPAIAIAGTGI